MAKHDVYVNLPWHELGKADAFFNVFSNNRKAGTITISKGAIEWYATNAKKPFKLTWKQFDKAVKAFSE